MNPRRLLAASLLVLLVAAVTVPTAMARPVPGRVVLELTEAGARALRRGELRVPLPVGGEELRPALEPLFVSTEGPLSRFALLTFDAGAAAPPLDDNAPWIEALRGAGPVLRAESDQVVEVAALPDDPYLTGVGGVPPQFHLHDPAGLSLRADRAWPFVPAGAGVVVGVIDTGVLWTHDDLGGPEPFASEVLWTNEAERNGTPGVDDDGNGYVDDVIGWDWVEIDEIEGSVSVLAGEDAHVPDDDPSDFAGHGTFVAGMVTARTRNGTGIAGAPEGSVRIMPLRVGWGDASGRQLVFLTFCSRAIEYATLNGADVINCSWNSIEGFGVAAAVDAAVAAGVVVVGSAGNSSTSSTSIQYLSSREDCIGVASVDRDGTKSDFSNYGSWVDIAGFGGRGVFGAPGLTFSRLDLSSSYNTNFSGGTSFAAPQIAGLAALLRAVAPDLAPGEIRDIIVGTGQDLSLLDPAWAPQLGGGIADFAAAIQAAGGGWDRALPAGGIAPFPGGRVAARSDSGMVILGTADGAALANLTGNAPLDHGNVLPVVADPGLPGGPLVLLPDGDTLLALQAGGTTPTGWPAALIREARSLVAGDPGGGGSDLVIVADGAQLQVYTGTGFRVAFTGFTGSSFTLADLEPAPGLEAAGIDASGMLRIINMVGEPELQRALEVGEATLPPVAGEFDGPGTASVVFAAPDTTAGSSLQRVHALRGGLPRGGFPVELDVPALTSLSLAGFAGRGAIEIVVTDAAGGIHVISTDGAPAARSVDADGPLAGEVLCADVDGDWESDLVALRADGTLLAWNAELQPLPGFPRHFPAGFAEGPALVDAGGRRYLVAADVEGGLWSLPLGPADTPAPWPTMRGSAERRGHLGYGKATPVVPAARLAWDEGDAGRLCWEGSGFEALSGLRLRVKASTEVIWEGEPRTVGCAEADGNLESPVVLEGLHRGSGWVLLGEVAPPSRLRLVSARPNPFAGEAELRLRLGEGPAELRIFDVRGRLVHRADLPAGSERYLWRPGEEGRVAAGLYFARLTQGSAMSTLRLVRLP